jgi:threonine synthase
MLIFCESVTIARSSLPLTTQTSDFPTTGPGPATTLRCSACGTVSDVSRPVTQCLACGGLLEIELQFAGLLDREYFANALGGSPIPSGVWRYQAMLPGIPSDFVVSRAEGHTPIYWDDRLADYAGLQQLGLKHEGQNPTGSFKDRGMTVGISHAKFVGSSIVACASTGNTSASLASYAAAGGLTGLVLVPAGNIAGGKLAQTVAHGARIVQVEGDFDAALTLMRTLTRDYPVYLVNSVNPFRLEGQKTIVFEMMEQLGWHPPDFIVLPGGNLGNTAAFGKALIELHQVGLLSTVPRLVTVQANGSAPFANYFERSFDRYDPVKAETVASAIKIGDPASVERARAAIQRTNGIVTSVSDDAILDAKANIDHCGIGCEPASAATLAGIRRLVGQGTIPADARVVGVLTGHILKDTEAVIRYHFDAEGIGSRPLANPPVTIPADMDALQRTLADALQS